MKTSVYKHKIFISELLEAEHADDSEEKIEVDQ